MEKKKDPQVDFSDKRALFLLLGLCTSISLTLIAFEFKSVNKPDTITFYDNSTDEDLYEVPITIIEPAKPPLQPPVLVEIPNDDTVIDIEPYIFDQSEPVYITEDLPAMEELPAEIAEEITFFIEEEASFTGGKEAWTKFLTRHLNYPRQAQHARIEGRVILGFVVNSQGQISNIEVLRGIGGGCEEEAIRVLSSSPKWNPGKQRGVAVKSRKQIAFVFRLN
ncbi:MAG: protein TonB [Roseivirga sp.]|jgi:protein TonB